MASNVDTLITRYVLDDQYTSKAKNIGNSTAGLQGRMLGLKGVIGGLGSSFTAFANVAVSALKGIVVGAGAVGASIVALGAKASQAGADLEALKMGLTSVAGSSEEAERQLKMLKEVAKAPGLGFKEAIQGAIRLQGAGINANLAMRALAGFGNALARVGGGKEDLDGVIVALTQIVSKGKVSAEEINQIAERFSGIRPAMQAAFGTSDTEALQKMNMDATTFIGGIVGELEKLPKVSGGAKNAFENLGDAVFQAFASAGEVINKYLVPAINKVADFIVFLVESGHIEKIAEKFMTLFSNKNLGDYFIKLISYVMSFAQAIPTILKNVFSYIAHNMDKIGFYIREVFKMAFALFLGGTLWNVVSSIVTLFSTMAKMATVTALATQTIKWGLGGLAIALTGLVGAYIGISATLDSLIPTLPQLSKLTEEALGIPSFDTMKNQSSALMNEFNRWMQRGNDATGADLLTGQDNTLGKKPSMETLSPLAAISRNTRETAQNTEKMVDKLDRTILGGGDLGTFGTTPLEMRSIKINAGSRSLSDALSELVSEVIYGMAKNGRITLVR